MEQEAISFLTSTMPSDWCTFLFRMALGLAWLPWGIAKLRNPAGGANFPRVFGMKPGLAYCCTAIIETVVPMCLIFGFLMRLALIPGITCMIMATKESIKNDCTSPAAPYLLGLIALFLTGPGAFSLDAALF